MQTTANSTGRTPPFLLTTMLGPECNIAAPVMRRIGVGDIQKVHASPLGGVAGGSLLLVNAENMSVLCDITRSRKIRVLPESCGVLRTFHYMKFVGADPRKTLLSGGVKGLAMHAHNRLPAPSATTVTIPEYNAASTHYTAGRFSQAIRKELGAF